MGDMWNPGIELFDIDSGNVMSQKTTGYFEQHAFLLCKKGHISLVLDEKVYDVCAGDMYIYPAFTQTRIRCFSDDLQGVVGTADFDFVLSLLDSISGTPSHAYIRFHPHVTLSEGQYRRVDEIIGFVRERVGIQTRLRAQVVSAFVQAFCYEVVDAYITNTPLQTGKQTRRDKVFQNFLAELYQNFHRHRDVRFYAGQQNLTPRYFATLVREASGKTPLQWIAMFVMMEAKRLLADPNNSVKEVAGMLNFTEQSFFGRYFKQHAGCSPSKYKSISW